MFSWVEALSGIAYATSSKTSWDGSDWSNKSSLVPPGNSRENSRGFVQVLPIRSERIVFGRGDGGMSQNLDAPRDRIGKFCRKLHIRKLSIFGSIALHAKAGGGQGGERYRFVEG